MSRRRTAAARGPAAAALPLGLADVRAAAAAIAGHVVRTPCSRSRTLSEITGAELWIKSENLQFTASFKERGARNRLAALSREERKPGVIAMSAGNHAQGVAYHAAQLGIPATIVMPEGTPNTKVRNTASHGAEVIITGGTLEEAAAFAHARAAEKGLTFVHPYNDPLVMAGQGTIGLEMLEQAPDLDTILVPIGGGGLVSGIATAFKALKPDVRIIGVQAAFVPAMYDLIKGTQHPSRSDTLAEGIAVKAPGALTEQVVRALVDDIVLVEEASIERAVCLLLTIEKTLAEGAGAIGLGAVLERRGDFAGRKVGLVLTGGNIDSRLLAGVLTRELARDGRLTQLSVDLSDKPGQLARVAQLIAEAQANILEVYHQRVFTDLPAKGAILDVVIETRDRGHLDDTVARIRHAGFEVEVKGHPGSQPGGNDKP